MPQSNEQPVDTLQTEEAPTSGVQRDTPDTSLQRQALVGVWTNRVLKAKAHWDYAYKRMRRDAAFARGRQWDEDDPPSKEEFRYVANLVLRHIQQKTASLYAKNPKAIAERRPTLDYAIWDGSPETALEAMQVLMVAQQQAAQLGLDVEQLAATLPQVGNALELVQDIEEGRSRRQLIDRLGRTLEVLYEHQVQEQVVPFKSSMKKLVRRTITTGVGYVKLGFHRLYGLRPEDVNRVTDVTEQIELVQRILADQQDGELNEGASELEELELTLKELQAQEEVLLKEGLDFHFPNSTAIIPDERCADLHGFHGCRWVAEEFMLTAEQVKELYKVDLGRAFTAYRPAGDGQAPLRVANSAEQDQRDGDLAAIYEIYDKATGLVYVVADGYPDFLEEPAPPKVRLERFWPFFTLIFNAAEDEKDIFPPSDVSLLRQAQKEHNLARQRLREHRDANRPKHVTPQGALSETDKTNLTGSTAHTVVELQGLAQGQRVEDLLQPVPHNPIDPALYETDTSFDDIMKVGGSQEANLGGAGGSTATETSIAEASRMSANSSNIDDLDDLLTELARAGSQVLLQEFSEEMVMRIAGRGAVWPTLPVSDIMDELWLEVQAGSSGRPNKQQDIQNFERLAPWLMQTPGVPPKFITEQILTRLDDRLDVEDVYIEGLPSMVAMNAMAQPHTGDPTTEPTQQGGRGGEAGTPTEGDANMGANNDAELPDMLDGPGVPNAVPLRIAAAQEGAY